MTYPQDGRPRVPSNRQAPNGRPYRSETLAETDDHHPHRRPSRRLGGEGIERRSGYDRPGPAMENAPTAGYYSAATPQRPSPRAGRGPTSDERPSANTAGPWTEPYPDQRRGSTLAPDRGWSGSGADDDWDTQVFSLLPNRAATASGDRAERTSSSPWKSRRDDPGAAERTRDTARPRTEAELARQVAAIASLAAGVVHVFATPAHWGEWPLAGAFFAATAGFQLLWGVLSFPIGNVFLRVVGILANLGSLGLWGVSRLWGVPFGPHAGVPEAFGAADLIAAASEITIVVGLLWSLLPRESHGVLSAGGYRAVVVLAFVALGAVAIPGSTAALEHSHSHDPGTSDHEDDGHDHGTDEHMDMESPTGSESSADTEQDATAPAEAEDHTHAPGEEHD